MNQQMMVAWKNAYFGRVKKLPKLSSIIMKTPSRKRQTWQEQLEIMDAMMVSNPKQVN